MRDARVCTSGLEAFAASGIGPSGHERCGAEPRRVNRHMARRSSAGEIVLGVIVVTLVAFVGSQVIASPRRVTSDRGRVLSGRDSAAIADQYRAQLDSRHGAGVRFAQPALVDGKAWPGEARLGMARQGR